MRIGRASDIEVLSFVQAPALGYQKRQGSSMSEYDLIEKVQIC